MPVEKYLHHKLETRERKFALRNLNNKVFPIDFCSNDYLGLGNNRDFQDTIDDVIRKKHLPHGSTGSRLLSGNYPYIETVETKIAAFHQGEAALIFNSGYDANIGLMSCMAQRGDLVLYDNLIHASLRDGIRLSLAASRSFPHNDLEALEKGLKQAKGQSFVVVESVYSMDGDKAPLQEITALCKRYDANLVVDEAHATGVVGKKGEGLVQHYGLQKDCFARVHTFGKALGVHGAAVIGSGLLRRYLVNYARSFIYTTALPPASIAAIDSAYNYFPAMHSERRHLQDLIHFFQQNDLPFDRPVSDTPIQIVIVTGNDNTRKLAAQLQQHGLDVRPILHPTVPEGKERLRIVLHSFNTREELQLLINMLRDYRGG